MTRKFAWKEIVHRKEHYQQLTTALAHVKRKAFLTYPYNQTEANVEK